MLSRACAYCRAAIDPDFEPHSGEDLVSQGICRQCLEDLMRGRGHPLAEFLESLCAPVFVVDREGRIAGANAYALSLVASRTPEIEGRPGGEVLGCSHSRMPAGCGESPRCRSCTIRLNVRETYQSGRPLIRRPACQDLETFEGRRSVRFLISTEKAGDAVLLRIDDARVADKKAG